MTRRMIVLLIVLVALAAAALAGATALPTGMSDGGGMAPAGWTWGGD